MDQDGSITYPLESRSPAKFRTFGKRAWRLTPGSVLFGLGALALAIPTMLSVARFSWSTEQGGHGPIVLAIGVWLLVREGGGALTLRRPGSPWIAAAAAAVFLSVYVIARITGILEIEGFAMYGALITAAYAFVGAAALRRMWFPILYLALVFPPPDTLVAAITQPIKIWISEGAVSLLHSLGYPIASSGVSIQIAQYDLLVAAACAGLNSIISLAAICLFYIYVRHSTNYRYAALLMLTIIPVAVFANFIRVVILILLTYYGGDSVAQGFMHDFAGLVMFFISVVTIFALDALLAPLAARLNPETARG